jgi:hypothetical protein
VAVKNPPGGALVGLAVRFQTLDSYRLEARIDSPMGPQQQQPQQRVERIELERLMVMAFLQSLYRP